MNNSDFVQIEASFNGVKFNGGTEEDHEKHQPG